MFVDVKDEVRNIELKQEDILLKLSNIENRLTKNTEIIMEYFATYKDKKIYQFCEAAKKGNLTKSQLSMLQELADILKEVLDDKEKLESKSDDSRHYMLC